MSDFLMFDFFLFVVVKYIGYYFLHFMILISIVGAGHKLK